MSENLRFVVLGRSAAQGSTKAYVDKQGKAHITHDSPKLKGWRQDIAWAAKEASKDIHGWPVEGPVALRLEFFFQPPKSKRLRVGWKNTRPDLDKLIRSVGDALKSILYFDDGQIAMLAANKRYGTPERVEIQAEHLGGTK